ncbi:MAG: hypothetical protein ABI323_07775 [Solirubrobacteraceae bacterium]
MILFSDADTSTPGAIGRLGIEVVPLEGAADALLQSLREHGQRTSQEHAWSPEPN